MLGRPGCSDFSWRSVFALMKRVPLGMLELLLGFDLLCRLNFWFFLLIEFSKWKVVVLVPMVDQGESGVLVFDWRELRLRENLEVARRGFKYWSCTVWGMNIWPARFRDSVQVRGKYNWVAPEIWRCSNFIQEEVRHIFEYPNFAWRYFCHNCYGLCFIGRMLINLKDKKNIKLGPFTVPNIVLYSAKIWFLFHYT